MAATNLLRFGLSSDKTEATVEPASAIATLTAEQIERAMLELAALRASMKPTVGTQPTPEQMNAVIPYSHPQLLPELGDAAILVLRDSGRGWLCYRLERSDLLRLQSSIQSLLDRPVPTKN